LAIQNLQSFFFFFFFCKSIALRKLEKQQQTDYKPALAKETKGGSLPLQIGIEGGGGK
jgi:hypothetical protein